MGYRSLGACMGCPRSDLKTTKTALGFSGVCRRVELYSVLRVELYSVFNRLIFDDPVAVCRGLDA